MKKLICYIGFLFVIILGTGCGKFLEEQSQDLSYAKSWQKLDEVMRGEVYLMNTRLLFKWLNVMDDDVIDFAMPSSFIEARLPIFGAYTWQANPFTESTFSTFTDDTWAPTYRCINAASIVAYQADQLSDNPQELRRVKGEALFMRAFYYFYMVNVYAKPYSKTTAKTEMGVPLKTTEYVEDRFFTRSTVDSVYQQIEADLSVAEQCLADGQSRPYHADINAVYLLQSRVYLYMQDWEKAAAAAGKLLDRKPDLSNLAEYKLKTSFLSRASTEILFSQGGNQTVSLMPESIPARKGLKPSDDLMGLYQGNDLRTSAFFDLQPSGNYRYTKVYTSDLVVKPTELLSDVFTLRVGEAYLNRAEALAMLNDADGANRALNTLRKSRFLPADFQPISLSGEALVNFVRDERRRELCFEGHRWFDLRRYSVNPQYPFSKRITHTYMDAPFNGAPFAKATLILEPNDPAYVFPIPPAVIIFNQGVLEQNPQRPDRKF